MFTSSGFPADVKPALRQAFFVGRTRFLGNILWLSMLTLSVTAEAAANKKPKANPGKAQIVNEQTQVILDGSSSVDTDGTITSYLWEQTAGDSVTLSGSTTQSASFASPLVKKPTKLTFKLTVTDNAGGKNSKAVNVQVKPLNTSPIANAGVNQSVSLGTIVSLNGSASSDTDGQIVKYLWKQTAGTKVKLTNANTATASFTAPSSLNAGIESENLAFTLTVTDDEKGFTSSAPVTVTVVKNSASVLSASLELNKNKVTKGGTITAIASAKGGKANYNFSINWGDGSNPSTSASSTHNFNQVGTYTVTLTVTDADGATKIATQNVSVEAEPLSAKFDLNGSTPAIIAGDTLTVRAFEIAGGTGPYKVNFDWGDGSAAQSFNLAAGEVNKSATHIYANLGNYTLKVTVTDAANITKTYTITVDVQAADPLGQC